MHTTKQSGLPELLAQARSKAEPTLSKLMQNNTVRRGAVGAGIGLGAGTLAELTLPRAKDDDSSRLKLPLLSAILGGTAGTLYSGIQDGSFVAPPPPPKLPSVPAPAITATPQSRLPQLSQSPVKLALARRKLALAPRSDEKKESALKIAYQNIKSAKR